MKFKQKINPASETKKDARKAFLRLSNNMVLAGADRMLTLMLFAQYFEHKNNPGLLREYQQLYSKEKLRNAISPSITSISQLSQIPFFDLSTEQLLVTLQVSFAYHAETLVAFETKRLTFERAILEGRFEDANRDLNQIEDVTGESIWAIRSRILLLALTGEIEQMGAYCETKRAQVTSSFMSTLLSWILLLTTDPIQHLRIVKSNIRELTKANFHELADLLSLLFVPTPLLLPSKRLECFQQLQSFPLVDRFVLLQQLLNNNDKAEFGLEGKSYAQIRAIRASAFDSLAMKDESISVSNLIHAYDSGNYFDLDRRFVETLSSMRSPSALIALLGKSDAISLSPPSQHNSPFADLREAAKQIYLNDRSSKQSQNELVSKAVQFRHFADADQYQALIVTVTPHAFAPEDRQQIAMRCRNSSLTTTPWLALCALGSDPILSYEYTLDESELPPHRVTKIRIRNLCSMRRETDVQELLKLLQRFRAEAALPRDYFELASSALLSCEALAPLLEICADGLVDFPSAVTAFPMLKLLAYVEHSRVCTLDAVIIAYFYATRIDAEKTYVLNETYEEFLLANGYRKPSDLAFDPTNPKEVLFLKDISTISTLDFLGTFESSNDLRAERIRLLDSLRDSESITPEAHRNEVDEILSQVIVDSGATEFNVSKINVNLEAIKRKVIDDAKALFGLYKSVKDDSGEAFIKYLQDPQQVAAMTVVAGDRNTTLLKIVTLVWQTFLFDERIGLDRNLSAEIRHGFFSNLMRSRLESRHLITELDEFGVYQDNTYWLEANSLVATERLVQIDNQLRWFSREFNELISKAEEWMKVTRDQDNKVRVFAFPVYVALFEKIKAIADVVSSADELVDVLLQHLSVTLDSALARMRERINVDLKDSVDKLFQDLLRRLDEARGGVALFELLAAIVQVKNEIREDITTAAGWFELSSGFEPSERAVPYLVDIAAECYGRVRPTPLHLDKKLNDELSVFRLDGSAVKAFLLALINLFENCTRHSGYGLSTIVSVTGSAAGAGWSLNISNPVTLEKFEELQRGKFAEALERMDAPEVVRVEGGSGLGKVVNQLHSISDGFAVTVNAENNSFVARILYEPLALC